MELNKRNERTFMNHKHDEDSSNIYTNLAITSNFKGKFNKGKVLDRESTEKYDHLGDKRNTTQYNDLKHNKNTENVRHTQYYEEIEVQKEITRVPNEKKRELKEDAKKETSAASSAHLSTTNTRSCFRIAFVIQVILTLGCCGISVYVLTDINKKESKAQYADSVWEIWGHWESCTVSCDVGMQTRHRDCISAASRHEHCYLCRGPTTEYRLCSHNPCSNSSWSEWGVWGSCSVTCGYGVHTRTRRCNIPSSIYTIPYCTGESVQVDTCTTKLCTDEFVAFNVKLTSVDASNTSTTMLFTDILFNVGDAYNTSTGVFTAPTAGLYQFNGVFCAEQSNNEVKYVLNAKGNQMFSGTLKLLPNLTECTSFGHVINVNQHGNVFINASYLYTERNIVNTFSGILIHKT